MTRRRSSALVFATIGLSTLAGCGADVAPYALTQQDDRRYLLETLPCAEEGAASVVETDEALVITNVSRGPTIDGDCLGVVQIVLARPLDERRVLVDGVEWIRVDADCERRRYRPPDDVPVRPERCEF